MISRTSDSLSVEWLNGSRETLPNYEVASLEVSGGHQRYMLPGTVAGAGLGAGMGLMMRAWVRHDLVPGAVPSHKIMPVSVAIGTAVGVLVGSLGTERWYHVQEHSAASRIGFVSPVGQGRIGIGLAERF